MKSGFLSIIIVNFNGLKWLKGCLSSIFSQQYEPGFEVILVDNASSDESVVFVEKNFPAVKIIKLSSNLGFAEGNNIGINASSGEYIAFVNNDTITKDKGVFLEVVKKFESDPKIGFIQPKICLIDNEKTLDVCGSNWTHTTFLHHFGLRQNSELPAFNAEREFFSLKGAYLFTKREVLDNIGLFDDSFWCYYEETDLLVRAGIFGYKNLYYPKVTVLHGLGGTSKNFQNSYIQFHNCKNKIKSFIKTYPGYGVFWVLVKFFFFQLGLCFAGIFKRKNFFGATFSALLWNIKELKLTLKERKRILKSAKQNPYSIFKDSVGLGYFIELLKY